jgi:hypothetical protein
MIVQSSDCGQETMLCAHRQADLTGLVALAEGRRRLLVALLECLEHRDDFIESRSQRLPVLPARSIGALARGRAESCNQGQ